LRADELLSGGKSSDALAQLGDSRKQLESLETELKALAVAERRLLSAVDTAERAAKSPEIVNISVNTPYPGTESWHTEARHVTTRDYRLYDIQHAVLRSLDSIIELYATGP
jgi:hypothetical protein